MDNINEYAKMCNFEILDQEKCELFTSFHDIVAIIKSLEKELMDGNL